MAVDNNFGFLAKQLALSEFPGRAATDITGGCQLSGSAFHTAIWDPTAIDNAEAFITQGLDAAKEHGLAWQSTLVMTSPGMEKTQAFKELTEALFVYGFPDAENATGGLPAPSIIQAIGKPVFKGPAKGIEINPAQPESAELAGLVSAAQPEESVLFEGFDPLASKDNLDLLVATADGKPVGILGCISSGVVCRAVHIWVEPDMRRKGIGQSLVAQAYENSQGRSELLFTCWASPKGTLRYFLSKLGFEEQVRAHYFVAE